MGMRKRQVIEVIVKGEEENKSLALQGLLESTEYSTLQAAMRALSPSRLKAVAQSCHGAIYRRLDGSW